MHHDSIGNVSPLPRCGPSARRLLALGLLTAVWAPSGRSQAYPLTFPSRGDALDSGAHFRAHGHTSWGYGNSTWAIDFHAATWDGAEWSRNNGGTTNEDDYIFGAPLYAPYDGDIIACWRTAPDKPAPGVDYDLDGDGVFGEDGNCMSTGAACSDDADCSPGDSCGPGHDQSPMSAGNHVVLRNSTGDAITLLAHMEYGSIPQSICPLPADRDQWDPTSSPGWLLPGPDGWPDDGTDECDVWGLDGYRQGTILAAPVPVEKGQFLGRVGHSGASSHPHLHLHVKPLVLDDEGDYCEDDSEEIEFFETWSQQCAIDVAPTGSWSPLHGSNPLQPWPLQGVCTDDADCAANEVCTGDAVDPGQCTSRTPAQCFLGDPLGPQADHDDLGVPATNLHFTTHPWGDVLAYQSGGALRLRSYDVSGSGSIADQDVQLEGSVLDLGMARVNGSRDVVVSIRGSNGKLKHIPYDVSYGVGTISRMHGKELSEGTIYQVESTPSPAHDGYVVAIEDGGGNLKVIDYHVDAGLNITRDYSSSGAGGPIDDVAITTMEHFDGVVTASISDTGQLELRSFEVPAAGGVTAVDTFSALVGGDSVTIDKVPTVGILVAEYVVTSVIQADQTLRVDTWRVESDGTLGWVDSLSGGQLSEHDGTAGSSIAGDYVLAVRDSDDEFRVIGYDVDWLGQLRRNATLDRGPVTQTAIVASVAGGGNHLVAARTDAQGDLHLFTYAENFNGLL